MCVARFLLFFVFVPALQAQTTHYAVKLTPDFDRNLFRGQETIEFSHEPGLVEWQKQRDMQIVAAKSDGGEATIRDETITLHLRRGGKHRLRVEYTAAPSRGINWFPNKQGFDTAFYCEAWMICDNSPAQRATLTLEVVLPRASELQAAGPGKLTRHWQDTRGSHFLFEQNKPVQTYLFSFGVANMSRARKGRLVIYTAGTRAHNETLDKTARAYAFLRRKAGVDPLDEIYVQAFLPDQRIAQEAAGLALMSSEYLDKLEEGDRIGTMTHELAHQWWGALVGIRSWSDFWLNEGMADFMMDAYLEQLEGKKVYDDLITGSESEMEKLREEGKDRPLHWDGWKNAHEALGRIPCVKGALFLDSLRKELGEEIFWRGIALYTSRNASRLVDSHDFERAMEEASGRDLKGLFDEGVYR